MSHTADFDSKYALPKFKTVASSQKRVKTFAIVGAGVLTLWIGALGAVAVSRHRHAQEAASAQLAQSQASEAERAASISRATAIAPNLAVNSPSSVPMKPSPIIANGTTGEKSVSSAPKSSRRSASHRGHSVRQTSKTLASRTVASKSASEPSAKRMKDDQLDALLKQFK